MDGMWRVAVLREKKDKSETGSLEVRVLDELFEKKEDVGFLTPTPTRYNVLGRVCFKDDREAGDIIKDFDNNYPSALRFNFDENGHYAEYHEDFRATLPLAFVIYFSQKAK